MATVALHLIAAVAALFHPAPLLDGDEIGLMGNAGHARDSQRPRVTAYFPRESYRPGETARLIVLGPATTVRLYRAGTESTETFLDDELKGSPIGPARPVRGPRVALRIGDWPSGAYFARLTGPGSRVGYAPFVLAPGRLGEHRIGVVLPTETWQAYNFRDDDGDGHPDTWYAGWKTDTARLYRPFLNRGVPPHWKKYDAPFVRWVVHTHPDVDFLSDAELRATTGDELARDYDLLIFSGHHEYVTTHEYDAVVRYRDVGGNLAFLAANNLFWKITISHGVMTRVAEWRDLGRPEAALIGVQYRANDRGGHRGPWILTADGTDDPWLFAGTGVGVGQGFGTGGIEIDATAPASPKGLRVIAQIPDLYGPGFTAQMTYYETPAGAKVFAAGAFSLARSVWDPGIDTIVANLWNNLSKP